MRYLLLLVGLLCVGAGSPRVLEVAAVNERLVRVRVQAFEITHNELRPYEPQSGDEVIEDAPHHDGVVRDRKLLRDGREVGKLVGPADDRHLSTLRRRVGEPADLAALTDPAGYSVGGIAVESVGEKRRPWGGSADGPAVWHDVYLVLAEPMTFGEAYDVTLPPGLDAAEVPLTFGPLARSPAVHATHVGFRPDDPAKRASLSHWAGTLGPVAFEPGTPFTLRDAATGDVVFEGEATMRLAVDQASAGFQANGRNFAGTDVLTLDFSAFAGEGTFVASVEGVGASLPFTVARDAYDEAFRVAMSGLLHQRSGVAWRVEDGFAWDQPRMMHPDDAPHAVVHVLPTSRLTLIDAHGGHEKVMDGWRVTDEMPVLDDAWGGYRDAGDHDRHTGHLVVAHRLLELYELFPEHFADLDLDMPEDERGLPDMLSEAVWVVDFFRRLQREDGAVHGGIESNGHPNTQEPSYLDQLDLFAFAPDVMASWRHAAAAAHAAHVLDLAGRPDLAAGYLDSATRAWAWAEAEYEKSREELESMTRWWEVRNDRNLAAAHLFRATGDTSYEHIFVSTAGVFDDPLPFRWESHDNVDAAFVYARTEAADPARRAAAGETLVRYAGERSRFAAGQAFGWTAKDDGAPLLGGFAAAVSGRVFALAHALTGDERWLGELVGTALVAAGDNPLDLTFMTGLGHASPDWPLQVDRAARGEAEPWPGYVVYGQYDPAFSPLPDWVTTWVANDETTAPPVGEWPVMETFFDIEGYLMWNENTVWQTGAPTAYAYGYLMARD